MSFRHDLMLSGGNHERLVKLARARNVDTDAVLCEALRAYIDQPDLYDQSIPLTVDGARIYINCALPDDLRTALAIAAQAHVVKPFGQLSNQTIFTRAVQHYFNQLAAADPQVAALPDQAADTAHAVPIMTMQAPTPYSIVRRHAAASQRKFKL